ncbi:PAS domain-containing protein [Luteibacter sp. 9133]|uniref:PAS domain-containing protein n=1 Tax=Luteibacter sp. 9133 TaxID=1500891 RepID=UPI00068B788B|nr:PAS domain-containing protein [Luteibacter sp. 9133]
MDYLEAENALLREGLRATRLGLCITDASGRVVQTAGDFADRLGINEKDLLGAELRLRMPATLMLSQAAPLLDIDSAELSTEGQLRRDGAIEKFLLFQARTVTQRGERFRVISVMDVSLFGVSRGRLSDLQSTLEAIGAGVIMVDAQAVDQPIAFVNRRFEQLTGYTAAECIGRNCRFLQGPDSDPQAISALRRAIALKQATQVVVRNYRKNGEAFDNELYVSPVSDDHNEVRWLVGIVRERRDRTLVGTGAA